MSATPDINEILALPVYKACGIRGADMGRPTRLGEPARLYLQRVRFQDACYDRGGAYWGTPRNLWCAFDADLTTMIFTRAEARKKAQEAILATIDDRTGDLRGWSFYW